MNKNKCSRFLFIELLISSRKKHLCYSWICNRSDRIDHNRYISTNSTRFQFECFSKNSISKINNFSLHFLFFFFRSFQLLLVIFHWFQLKCDQTYFFYRFSVFFFFCLFVCVICFIILNCTFLSVYLKSYSLNVCLVYCLLLVILNTVEYLGLSNHCYETNRMDSN